MTMTKFSLKNYDLSEKALMITLTASGDINDGGVFSRELNYFMVNLKRYLKERKLKYVCVREVQRRGVYHYHIVLFDYYFIPFEVIDSIWRLGYVWVSCLDGKEAVSYILKYIRKGEKFEGIRLHSSYYFLSFFKSEFLKLKEFFRKQYFFGKFLNYCYSKGLQLYKVVKGLFDLFYNGKELFLNIKSIK